jgi:hypothetical protein
MGRLTAAQRPLMAEIFLTSIIFFSLLRAKRCVCVLSASRSNHLLCAGPGASSALRVI